MHATNILSMVFDFLEFDATTDIPSENSLEDRLENSFRCLQNKAHIPLLLFVILLPIPNYNVDDFVLRGAGRRRVSDYCILQPLALSTFMFNFVKGERGRATTCLEA